MDVNLTRRCALVYYARKADKLYLLLGMMAGELTSIGGRRKKGESDLDCCCREVFEETKELVNFYPYKHGLHSGTIYTHSACVYYVLEESYDVLAELCQTFRTTVSSIVEQNELNELILFDLDKLTEMLVRNTICAKDELKSFVLNVLYRLLRPFSDRCVFIEDIAHRVRLTTALNRLPPTLDIVSESNFSRLLEKPVVYGRSMDTQAWLTECFYETVGMFRSGSRMYSL